MRVLVACEYKPIDGFPRYRISSDGRVQSRWRPGTDQWSQQWNDLRPSRDHKGYLGLTLCNEDGHKKVRVHRLVAVAFLPNPENLPCVRHIDGDPSNNHVENLAWSTYAENESDKRKHGTWNTRVTNARLTSEQRDQVVELKRLGQSNDAIAKHFGVSRPTISRLLNGKTWRAI